MKVDSETFSRAVLLLVQAEVDDRDGYMLQIVES